MIAKWADMRLRDPEVIGIWRQREKLEAVHLEAPAPCVKGQHVLFHSQWTVTAKHCKHKYKMERKKESQGNLKNQENKILTQSFHEKKS